MGPVPLERHSRTTDFQNAYDAALRQKGKIMDFKRNKHFFDKDFATKTKFMMIVGVVFAAVAALLLVVGWYGPLIVWYMWWYGGTPLIVAGAVLIFVGIGRNVKESEVTDSIEKLVKEVGDICAEKLKYPKDLEEKSAVFCGSEITPENADEAVRLSNGAYIGKEIRVTYVYISRNKLWCYVRRASLVQDSGTADQFEIPFTGFDSVKIEDEEIAGIKVYNFRLYNGKTIVFNAPVTAVDYYKEEFCEKIVYARKKAL